MAIPNLIGVYIWASVVKKESTNYFLKLSEREASK
jgi:Na+/alanine symporter